MAAEYEKDERRDRNRFLLICGSFVLVGVVWLMTKKGAVDSTVKLIERRGGAISVEDDFSLSVRYVTFDTSRAAALELNDEKLAEILARTPALEKLNLLNTKVTGKSIPVIAGLTNLRRLDLPASAVSVADFAALKSMPNLRQLWIRTSFDEKVDEIKRALPRVSVYKSVEFPFGKK